VFNALCALFGAIGVQESDNAAIISDPARNKSVIRQGFRNIREMACRGGTKVAQSEKFLRALLKTMTRRGRKVHPLAVIFKHSGLTGELNIIAR
jgi:hypothetical protein